VSRELLQQSEFNAIIETGLFGESYLNRMLRRLLSGEQLYEFKRIGETIKLKQELKQMLASNCT